MPLTLHIYCRFYLLSVVLCLFSLTTVAEPMAAPGDKTKAVQLKLSEIAGKPGRWHKKALTLSGDKEQRFFVRGLNPAAPLSVQLITEDTSAPASVSLHRLSWINADYQAALQQGLFRFDGRAYGDVGIRIKPQANASTKATLLLWQGEPVIKPFVSFYRSPAASGSQTSTDNNQPGTQWWHIAIVLLLLVIGVLLLKLLRKPASLGAVIAISVATSSLIPSPPLNAQDKDDKPPVEQAEPETHNPFDIPKDAKPVDVTVDKNKDASAGNRADKDKDKPQPQNTDKDKDKAGQDTPQPKPDNGGTQSSDASYQQRIAAAEQHVQALSEQVSANRAELERLRLLLEQDRDNEPDADNLPALPLSCKPPHIDGDGLVRDGDAQWENFERCQQCYAQPLADLEQHLLVYEKLRVIYRSTKDYVNNAITLGDKVPKPHTLLENSWAGQKYAINQSFEKTKQAYDAKLPELNSTLSDILDRVGQCETDFNNNPMWRQTAGIFFYNTMATSYKRSD